MSSNRTLSGSCHCGSTTFHITVPHSYKPQSMFCHCATCAVLSGSLGTYNISFPLSSLTWDTDSKLSIFDEKGDSGRVNQKAFCTGCSSTLTTLSKHRNLAIMKVPYMRDAVRTEYPSLLESGLQWEQYVTSKFKWEPDVASEDVEQINGMKG